MKHRSTVRRELNRLKGILKRDDLTPEHQQLLRRAQVTLEWVLEGRRHTQGWLRPSEMVYGIRCRKGDRP